MTAEIVVMNREAIVLAADSAVTIGEIKTLNTANKVFMLIPKYPIGVLLYNNATLMGIPWEILIKSYRDYALENKVDYLDLADYAKDFLKYLEDNGSRFFIDEQENAIFNNMIYSEFGEILRLIWKNIKEVFYANAQISEEEITEIATEVISTQHDLWKIWPDILDEEKTTDFRKRLNKRFGKELTKIKRAGFGEFSLSRTSLNKLTRIAWFKFSKKEQKQVPSFTGIVFAGYGKDNLFPVCVNYEIYCYLCDTLIYRQEDERRIGFKENITASIIPFAQQDIVHNVLKGILPYYEGSLRKELVSKFKEDDVNEILKNVEKSVWDFHTEPIINTIDSLPKDELAVVASTLVNLTSFMRHVSSDVESVGGPVDVAVISKKDGFIWIDRKHYFDISKNIHFNYETEGEIHAEPNK